MSIFIFNFFQNNFFKNFSPHDILNKIEKRAQFNTYSLNFHLTGVIMKTFQEIMFSDLPKTIDEYLAQYGTKKLYHDSNITTELKDNNLMTESALKTIVEEIENSEQLKELDKNNELLKCYVDLDCFDSLLRVYEKISEFVSADIGYYKYFYNMLLEKEWLFSYAQETNKLTIDLAEKLLNVIERTEELDALCANDVLVSFILKNFLIDPKENRELKTDELKWNYDRNDESYDPDDAFERENINIFEYIKESLEDSKFESLLNVYEYVYDKFDENEKVQLAEALKDNEIAKNRLKDIAENHLENEYDFESLIQYLKKPEKKNLINV